MLRYSPIVAALGLVFAGCAREPYNVASVSGRVTVNGKPYAKLGVMFQPVAPDKSNAPGPGSTGITDADGRYTLKLVGKETSGAVVGKHRVAIANYSEPGDPNDDNPQKQAKPAIQIPAKYSFMEGKLTFDVPASGTNKADFELKAP